MKKTGHVSQVNYDSISFGVLSMMKYYDKNNIMYPEWLMCRFTELPRYSLYNSSLLKHFISIPYNIPNTESSLCRDGEMTIWIIEKLNYEWISKTHNDYYFEDELDAMAFKLRWL